MLVRGLKCPFQAAPTPVLVLSLHPSLGSRCRLRLCLVPVLLGFRFLGVGSLSWSGLSSGTVGWAAASRLRAQCSSVGEAVLFLTFLQPGNAGRVLMPTPTLSATPVTLSPCPLQAVLPVLFLFFDFSFPVPEAVPHRPTPSASSAASQTSPRQRACRSRQPRRVLFLYNSP